MFVLSEYVCGPESHSGKISPLTPSSVAEDGTRALGEGFISPIDCRACIDVQVIAAIAWSKI